MPALASAKTRLCTLTKPPLISSVHAQLRSWWLRSETTTCTLLGVDSAVHGHFNGPPSPAVSRLLKVLGCWSCSSVGRGLAATKAFPSWPEATQKPVKACDPGPRYGIICQGDQETSKESSKCFRFLRGAPAVDTHFARSRHHRSHAQGPVQGQISFNQNQFLGSKVECLEGKASPPILPLELKILLKQSDLAALEVRLPTRDRMIAARLHRCKRR